MRNQVQLIAYADRLGGSLAGLSRLLHGPLAGLFGGVHVLPFFRPYDGADAGFDPEDHTEVDPRLGDWEDVRRLGGSYETTVDLIVNHISTGSLQFRDWLERGDESPYAGMFLTYAAVFPQGATEQELASIYRPRPSLPFTAVTIGEMSRRMIWTTFTSRQADLDVGHPETRRYLSAVLKRLAGSGVSTVRLDAIGYAVKTPGTSSFCTPETLAFVAELSAEARDLGLEVLAEVHAHPLRQLDIARHVDRVYDFALPPLVLHALFTADAVPLRRWLEIRPHNALTVLDTHDGIGVIDAAPDQIDPSVGGLLDWDQVNALVERIHAESVGTSRVATGASGSNLDIYQVNSTFYDALGRDDRRYLLARLVQFFAPGIPQVYYVGLLAGTNDMELHARTGVGRDVNRHHYSDAEIMAGLQQPVVHALARLIRFRNAHPAFTGDFESLLAPDGSLVLRWRSGDHEARLDADLGTASTTVTWTTEDAKQHVTEVAALPF